jgi:ABC-type polar amino acid transport system ATPase subunit
MRFARDVADRIITMEAGAIVEEGSPAEFFGQEGSEPSRNVIASVQ